MGLKLVCQRLINVINPAVQVSGELSDGKVRTVTADVPMDIASGGLYGATQDEHESQWYMVLALAADEDEIQEHGKQPLIYLNVKVG